MRPSPLALGPLRLFLALIAASLAAPVTAQTAATVPANYHGPNVVGFCFFVQNNAASYAGPINISNYFRFDAERAFKQFVSTQPGAANTSSTCRWITEQQYNALPDKTFQATDRSGHPVPAQQLPWQYTPGSGGMNAAHPTPPASTAAATSASPSAATSSATSAAAAAPSSVTASVTQQVSSSKDAITSSGATVVTDTINNTTSSVTDNVKKRLGGFIPHKSTTSPSATKSASPAAAAPASDAPPLSAAAASTPAAPPSPATRATADPAPGPLTANVDASPTNVTLSADPIPASTNVPAAAGPNFVFCHLVAGTSEYVSDIFPSTDTSDAAAQTAFWQQVGRKYKTGSIPFSNNVTCARSSSESGATTARHALMAAAPRHSLKVVDTQWTWMGSGQ